jgi:hypothetical protein
MNQTSILSWSLTTVLLALSISLLRNKRRQPPLDFDNFVVLASSTGGFFIGMKVILQALLDARVMKLVEWDGVIALFIGGSFTCYLAIKEIIKLLHPSS